MIVNEDSVDLKPLTILVGPDEGGKSSILETIMRESGKRFDVNNGNFFFISASRGSWSVQGEPGSQESLGILGNQLLFYLARIFSSSVYENEAAAITRWAKELGVLGLNPDSQFKTYVNRGHVDPRLKAALEVALSSTGPRQVLTVIAWLFGTKRGSLIIIEEPEIGLHPEFQVKLVEMFAEAIKDGKQVVITTHSSLLLLSLSRPIKRGDLKREDVAIYDVTKDVYGTQITPLELTNEGYIKGWIPSFKKVEQDLMREWVQSMPDVN